MILQYKGFNNNWCFEEAETISFANVWVGKETRDYREGGSRYKLHQEKLQECETNEQKENLNMKYVHEMHDAVDRLIKKETYSDSDEIIYNISTSFDQMENVCVVILTDKTKNKTYVFDKGVYLLNNHGQTVQRLC